MCGICVVVSDVGAVEADLLHGMCERIVHRGPDAEGLHVDGRVGLGMRRLSVIDLPGGQQPIFNEDRSMAIVFNGEIYNYRELRDELVARGHTFSTASDTEAILHAYEEYGEAAVTRLRGMFAFAIHERKSGRVFLARDRLGMKPLHWAEAGGRFYAASELKSLRGPARPVADARRGGGRSILLAALRPGAADHLPRDQEAAARLPPGEGPRPAGGDPPLLAASLPA